MLVVSLASPSLHIRLTDWPLCQRRTCGTQRVRLKRQLGCLIEVSGKVCLALLKEGENFLNIDTWEGGGGIIHSEEKGQFNLHLILRGYMFLIILRIFTHFPHIKFFLPLYIFKISVWQLFLRGQGGPSSPHQSHLGRVYWAGVSSAEVTLQADHFLCRVCTKGKGLQGLG